MGIEMDFEKIDIVRERTGVNYKVAAQALEETNGDVLEAIMLLEDRENNKQGQFQDQFYVRGNEVLEKVKEIIQKGNATKIRVKHDGKLLVEIPVTVGAIGAMLAPYLAAFGVIAAVLSKASIEIEKE
mgnify:CR=1 FL=1